ncbi:hypothetical protein NBO_10g0056 [Nosema bombycis CQ1]|uniref:Uncharacterized protein n=2 Tax=Nosema bombycis (strain CQ1 / CVCC 102059) TaxID=578461 RepID=R0KVX8_NOSB1|nr:hypothetical protein NBO_10g0056 [Nosema bombycis CQ1]|eukprot:EOB15066.1 hypothetical protein NBO_10g0056 [Nosema bombycis CQ1]
MGNDIPKQQPSPKPKPKPTKETEKENSMDDLFFVLKNMPNKSKGKEGKELYVEGDFETPKDNKLDKKKFKFVGLIKSSNK